MKNHLGLCWEEPRVYLIFKFIYLFIWLLETELLFVFSVTLTGNLKSPKVVPHSWLWNILFHLLFHINKPIFILLDPTLLSPFLSQCCELIPLPHLSMPSYVAQTRLLLEELTQLHLSHE